MSAHSLLFSIMWLKTPLFPIYTQRCCVTEYLVAKALACVIHQLSL